MAWFAYNNSIVKFLENTIDLSNTTDGAFICMLLANGTFTATDTTVADVIASSLGEATNVTRQNMTGVSINTSTPGQPKFSAANVAFTSSGADTNTNAALIYYFTGASDAARNAAFYTEFTAQDVSNGSTLTLDLTAGITVFDDTGT